MDHLEVSLYFGVHTYWGMVATCILYCLIYQLVSVNYIIVNNIDPNWPQKVNIEAAMHIYDYNYDKQFAIANNFVAII